MVAVNSNQFNIHAELPLQRPRLGAVLGFVGAVIFAAPSASQSPVWYKVFLSVGGGVSCLCALHYCHELKKLEPLRRLQSEARMELFSQEAAVQATIFTEAGEIKPEAMPASDWESDDNSTLENFFALRGLSVQEAGGIQGFCKSRHMLKLAPNTSVKKVLSLESDMKAQLGVDAQISAQLGFVAIDIPLEKRDFIEYQPLANPIKDGCAMLIGFNNFTRDPIVVDLADANTPHICVGGVTGGGKTQWAIAALKSVTDWYSPEEVRLIVFDPKQDDSLVQFADCPHLEYPILVEPADGVAVLKILSEEMKKRQSNKEKTPHIVVLIEEIADYLAKDSPVKDEAFDLLAPLLRKGRSAGIHFICSTQYPKNEILPTSISSNLPLKICFRMDRDYKAEIILGETYAATKLQGKGHGVALVPAIGLVEFQAPYVTDIDWVTPEQPHHPNPSPNNDPSGFTPDFENAPKWDFTGDMTPEIRAVIVVCARCGISKNKTAELIGITKGGANLKYKQMTDVYEQFKI